MLTIREWLTIQSALHFTAQYSAASGKSKASTDELRRVCNIVQKIVQGLDKEARKPRVTLK